jgi:hypothetical protein
MSSRPCGLSCLLDMARAMSWGRARVVRMSRSRCWYKRPVLVGRAVQSGQLVHGMEICMSRVLVLYHFGRGELRTPCGACPLILFAPGAERQNSARQRSACGHHALHGLPGVMQRCRVWGVWCWVHL